MSALRGELLERPTYPSAATMMTSAGKCYRSFHAVYGRTVVQKTISLLGREDSIAHEPGLLKEFQHPHVVEVWEAQWDPDQSPSARLLEQVTFVMPYYEGGSVADALNAGHVFSVGDAVAIARQTLEALEYVHTQHRVVH